MSVVAAKGSREEEFRTITTRTPKSDLEQQITYSSSSSRQRQTLERGRKQKTDIIIIIIGQC
jgi:hypothetical protein